MKEPDYRWIGKFVGFVRDTADPDNRGRIRLFCPEVMGSLDDSDHWLDWALPCFPWFAHLGIGGALVPQKLSGWGVWVEFRHGDTRFPIWTGVFATGPIPDVTNVELDSPTIQLGGQCVQTPGATNEGVVLGCFNDTFTGAPYSVLGSASTRIFAKKS